MRVELLPGLTNVIRFPLERRARPTLDLLREIAPDAREVGSAIEAFGLQDPTVGLRDAVDANTADHIANHMRGGTRHIPASSARRTSRPGAAGCSDRVQRRP